MTIEKIKMPLTLDKDGFLRRECLNCKRQFKWFPSKNVVNETDKQTYYCPYCGKPADADSWWTGEQLEYATKYASAKIMGPALDNFAKDLKRLNKPGGIVRFDAKHKAQPIPAPPYEPNDMRKIVPPCHPSEPLKIDEKWEDSVFCLVCGKKFTQTIVR